MRLEHQLKYNFLLITKTFDESVTSQVHGAYDLVDFYKNRIVANNNIASTEKELLNAIYSFILVFMKESAPVECLAALNFLIQISLSDVSARFGLYLSSIIDSCIVYCVKRPDVPTDFIRGDYEAHDCELSLPPEQGDAEIAEEARYLAIAMIHYCASHPKFDTLKLVGVNDTAIVDLEVTCSSIVFVDCQFTAQPLCELFELIFNTNKTKHISISGGNLIRNPDNQRQCRSLLHAYYELESFNILDEGFLFVSNIFNEFIYQRKKLLSSMPRDSKHGQFFSDKIYRWVDGCFNQNVVDFTLMHQHLEALNSFQPDSDWSRDIKIHLKQCYELLLGSKVKTQHKPIYSQLMQAYNQLKMFNLYKIDYRYIVSILRQSVEKMIKNCGKPSGVNELDSLCFSILLFATPMAVRTFPKEEQSQFFKLLESYIAHYSSKHLPDMFYDYDIIAGIHATTVAYLKKEGASIQNKCPLNANQCSVEFISNLLKIAQKIYQRSRNDNLRVWTSVIYHSEFDLNQTINLFERNIPETALKAWDRIVKNMSLQKISLESFEHLSSWKVSAYLIMGKLLLSEQQLVHQKISKIVSSSKSKKACNFPTLNAEFIRGLNLSVEELTSWCASYDSALDEDLRRLFARLLDSDFYAEMVINKQPDRFDYWDVVSNYYLIMHIFESLIHICSLYSHVSDLAIERMRASDSNKIQTIFTEKKIYTTRLCFLKWIYELQTRHLAVTKRILENSAEFTARYGYTIAVPYLPQQIGKNNMAKQELLLKVCNTKLLRHQEYVDSILKELDKSKPVKQSKKKKTTSANIQPALPVEESVETHFLDDNIPSAIDLAHSKLKALALHQHYERALIYIQLADCHHAVQNEDESKQAIADARLHIQKGIDVCNDNQQPFDHFTSLEFALFEDAGEPGKISLQSIQKRIRKGNILESIDQLNKMIAYQRKRKPLMLLASLYEKTLQFSEAANCYCLILESSFENDIIARSLLIHNLCRLNRLTEAEKHLDLCGDSSIKYVMDARIRFYIHSQHFDDAYDLLESQYFPQKGFNFLFSAAKFLYKMFYLEDAKSIIDALLLREFNALQQQNILSLACDIYFELDGREAIEPFLDRLSKMDRKRGYIKQTEFALKAKSYAEAQELNAELLASGGNSIQVLLQKFDCEFGLKRYTPARITLEQSLKNYPNCSVLYTLKHKLDKIVHPAKRTHLPLPEAQPQPQLINDSQIPPLLFEKQTKEQLTALFDHFIPHKTLQEIVSIAQEYNVKLHFYGEGVYQYLLGKHPKKLQIAIQGTDQQLINFIKIKFHAAQDSLWKQWKGVYGDTLLKIQLCSNLKDHKAVLSQLRFSTEEFIIDDGLKLIDVKNNAEQLFIEGCVTVNPAQVHTGMDLLSGIRYAHDHSLKISNFDMYFACKEMLVTIRPYQWVLEFAAVLKSVDLINTLDLWFKMNAFALIIPRLQDYFNQDTHAIHHIINRLLHPKNPYMIASSHYPGIAYFAECLLLLQELAPEDIEPNPSLLAQELCFYSELPDWQRYQLLNYLENSLPMNIVNPEMVVMPSIPT